MGLFVLDSFSCYANSLAVPLDIWTGRNGSPSINSTGGRRGGGCMVTAWQEGLYVTGSAESRWAVGFAFYMDDPPEPDGSGFYPNILQLEDAPGTGNCQLSLQVTSTGAVRLSRGNQAATLGESAAGVVVAGTWVYLELLAVLHDSAGRVEVIAARDQVIDFSGDTTQTGTATADTCRLGNSNGLASSATTRYADVAVQSGSAAALLGPLEINRLPLTGDGTHTDLAFTGAATRWQAVNDSPGHDGDTSFVAGVLGSNGINTAVHSTTVAGHVLAVQTRVYARATSGTGNGCAVVRSGGTDYEGASGAYGTSYACGREVWTDDPATGSAWLAAAVNAVEVGAKVL